MLAALSEQPGRRLRYGIEAISAYFGMDSAKANRLAAQRVLPGVFKLGRGYVLDEAVAEEQITAKAKGGQG